jgi:hypothetical protein
MATTRKDRRTRVPKAKKPLVLVRDRKFEKTLRRISVEIQRKLDEEERQVDASWGRRFPNNLVIRAA